MGFEFMAGAGHVERFAGGKGWRVTTPLPPLDHGDRLRIVALPPYYALLFAYRDGHELLEVDLSLAEDGSLRGVWQGRAVKLALQTLPDSRLLIVHFDLAAEIVGQAGRAEPEFGA